MTDNEALVFTPSALLEIIASVDELSEYDIGLTETIDGHLQLQVGSSYYDISPEESVEISVDDQTVNEINQVNEDSYEDLGVDQVEEPVEGGIIKQIGKTLLVGGAVRLASKLLKN